MPQHPNQIMANKVTKWEGENTVIRRNILGENNTMDFEQDLSCELSVVFGPPLALPQPCREVRRDGWAWRLDVDSSHMLTTDCL